MMNDRFSKILAVAVGLLLVSAATESTCSAMSKDGALMNSNLRRAAAYSAQYHGVSMLVMKDGEIIFEDYPNGHLASEAHELASGTKSFSGVVALAAQEDGLLSLDEKVSQTITEWNGDPTRENITIRQLLTLTSGIKSRAMNPPPYARAIQTPIVEPPGTVFQYGAAPFQIFGELMRRKLRPNNATMVDYLRARVLSPAGIRVDGWRHGPDGMPLIPQGAAMTAREWAKFGELVRRGGFANGKQIIRPNDIGSLFVGTNANPMYGLTWWLNRPISDQLRRTVTPLTASTDLAYGTAGVPNDLVMAAGLGKQRLYVMPAEHMVVVRQADHMFVVRQADHMFEAMLRGDNDGFSDTKFLQLLLLGH